MKKLAKDILIDITPEKKPMGKEAAEKRSLSPEVDRLLEVKASAKIAKDADDVLKAEWGKINKPPVATPKSLDERLKAVEKLLGLV